MLDFISWKEFLLFLAVATVIYYAYTIGLAKLKALRNPNRKWQADPPIQTNANDFAANTESLQTKEEENPDDVEETKYKQLEQLADELQELLNDQGESLPKNQLVQNIRQHIAKYPQLNQPPFHAAINNLIDRCIRDYDILLNEEELKSLWMQQTG